MAHNPIRQLSEDVINKIAAGEVINRPRNVVKELIENSLDAGAKSIHVIIKFEGCSVKFIKVKDDGHGIQKEDFKRACERFCTSKLQKFEDLSHMTTFGFRGEALSSICQVAKVKITSRVKEMQCGYMMSYDSGKPVEDEPKIYPINCGTQVIIEDLFYNSKMRKSAMKSPAEEYRMIVELVSLYSLDNLQVAFGLEKEGNNHLEVKTTPGESFIQRVKSAVSPSVAQHLVYFKVSDPNMGFSAEGYAGDSSSNLKSYQLVFFINHRLIDCQPLKKSLETLYRSRLAKGSCPFVFISIQILPENLDVNIHPTKSEVRFLYEEAIVSRITSHVDTILSTKTIQKVMSDAIRNPNLKRDDVFLIPAPPKVTPKLRPESMDRSDHTNQSITGMWKRQKADQEMGRNSFWRDVRLKSVMDLRKKITEDCDQKLRAVLKESTYIGCPKTKNIPLCYIQHKTFLIRLEMGKLTQQLFYQLLIKKFGNFSLFRLSTPLSFRSLIESHQSQICDGQMEEKISQVMEKKEMLDDYFSLIIDENGKITCMPNILNGYTPDWRKLPQFAYDMVTQVDWNHETECFRSFGKVLSSFYSVTTDTPDSVMKDFIYPVMKKRLKPPVTSLSCFQNLTDTKNLYRVFHRC